MIRRKIFDVAVRTLAFGILYGFKTYEVIHIGIYKVLAHQIFEQSEARCKKLFLAHGHKIDRVEWEFNTCQMYCSRCRVRLFFNITVAGGSCYFDLFFGKGVEHYSLGSVGQDDKRNILTKRYNLYLCDKVSSLM